MAKISEKEYADLTRLIFDISGIQLEKGKEYLIEARLEPVLVKQGLASYDELYKKTLSETSGHLKTCIIEAITINETYFFRDNKPFELLKNKIIPDLIDIKSSRASAGGMNLKIWSAACSTGQEVYSIAMTVREMFPGNPPFDINILGTDISGEAVARASYGEYNQFEIDRGLNSHYLNKYFTRVAKGWRIKDEIRSMVRFAKADLSQELASLGSFDIIFCRNIAIYFPQAGKIRLFKNLAAVLNRHGSLIVGGSESLVGLAPDFVPRYYLNSVFYQLKETFQSDSGLKASTKTLEKRPELPKKPPSFSGTASKPIQAQPAATSQNAFNLKLKKQQSERAEIKSDRVDIPPTSPSEPKNNPPPIIKEDPRPSELPVMKKDSLLANLREKGFKKPMLFEEQKRKKTTGTSLLQQLKEREQEGNGET